MSIVVLDSESDGFAYECTKLHVLSWTEDGDEKNTTHLTVTKNRPFATTGPAGMLRYDVDTTMVQEYTGPAEPETPERGDGIPF